jgi:23S rRNA (uracil1939-C5)-methyltransferase
MSEQFIIESISNDLKGVSHKNGKTCFIEGALPGERVQALLVNRKTRYENWQAVSIDQAAAERVQPKCPYINDCGGCQAAHISHQAQIAWKEAALLDQLKKSAGIIPRRVIAPLIGQSEQYRRRARLAYTFSQRSRKVSLGFRQKKQSDVVNIEGCLVLEPSLSALISPLRGFCQDRLRAQDAIGHIELLSAQRALRPEAGSENASQEQQVVLFRLIKEFNALDLAALSEFAVEQDVRVFFQMPELQPEFDIPGQDQSIPVRIVELIKGQYVEGLSSLSYLVCDDEQTLRIAFSPNDFIQANANINEQMVKLVKEELCLDSNVSVYEFFSGVGNFTLPIAGHCRAIKSFEVSSTSVAQARDNVTTNGIDNVECYQIDLTDKVRLDRHLNKQCDRVLLDPPRTGAAELVGYIKTLKPKRVVYVSCNPSTLGRDARMLVDAGYELEAAGIIDMFANTPHAEAIAVFELNEKTVKKIKKKKAAKNLFGF